MAIWIRRILVDDAVSCNAMMESLADKSDVCLCLAGSVHQAQIKGVQGEVGRVVMIQRRKEKYSSRW